MKDLIRNWNYDFISGLCNFVFDNYYDVNVEGLENIVNDKEGGIIVSNHDTPQKDWIYEKDKEGKTILHINSIDQLLIVAYLNPNQRFHAIVNRAAYKNIIKKVSLNLLQQIPATRYGLIDHSEKYLNKNEYILIFPEGSSGQKSGVALDEETKIYPGIGRLISHLDNPKIFPVNIQINGKKDNLWPKFSSAKLKFGESFHYLDEFGEFPTIENGNIDYSQISKEVMNEKVYPLG
ncbi:hypothetical protein HOA59_00245 [archaeon]|nr:hypothetical protein [archaeon]MBT6823851.1 hypothetical protein [archaeon]MBT7107381.1 hypothetical protein [archaeon]MBT7297224.1 hypothetical protein [archaeon]